MSIRLDLATAASGALPGMIDREDAQARQDKWMLEIERAMWANAARPAQQRQPDAVPSSEAERAPATTPAALTMAPFQTRVPVATAVGKPAAQAGVAPSVSASAYADAERHGASGDANTAATSQDGAIAGQQQAVITPGQSGLTQLGGPDAPALLEGQVGLTGTLGALALPATIASALASQTYAPGNPALQGIAAAPAAATALALTPNAQAAALADVADPGFAWSAAPADASEPERADARPASTGEAEPYASRNLHLQPDGDGVRAWIRDAALDGMQARSVAQALSAELARQGTVLTSVVVNGRVVAEQSRDASTDDVDAEAAAPDDKLNESFVIKKSIKGVA